MWQSRQRQSLLSEKQLFEIQPLLDEIMPGLLSVGTVLGLYALIRKNVSVIKIMLILVVIGIAGAFLGVF